MEIAILASGCFWGPEIKFSKLNGIIKTEVGYCGGNSAETTYKEVCTDKTNHAANNIDICGRFSAKNCAMSLTFLLLCLLTWTTLF